MRTVLDGLQQGLCFSRKSWSHGKFIVKQVPQTITPDIVPNMTSLPQDAKNIIIKEGPKDAPGFLRYHSQVLIVTTSTVNVTSATYFIPTWEDIFANDWIQVEYKS